MRTMLRFSPGELEPLIWQTANHALVDPEAKKGGKQAYIAMYIDGLFDELHYIAERRRIEGCTDPAIHLGYVLGRVSCATRFSYDTEWFTGLPPTAEETFNSLYAQEARSYVNSLLGTIAGVDVGTL